MDQSTSPQTHNSHPHIHSTSSGVRLPAALPWWSHQPETRQGAVVLLVSSPQQSYDKDNNLATLPQSQLRKTAGVCVCAFDWKRQKEGEVPLCRYISVKPVSVFQYGKCQIQAYTIYLQLNSLFHECQRLLLSKVGYISSVFFTYRQALLSFQGIEVGHMQVLWPALNFTTGTVKRRGFWHGGGRTKGNGVVWWNG